MGVFVQWFFFFFVDNIYSNEDKAFAKTSDIP